MGYLSRWAGGFGGLKTARSTMETSDRKPDHVCRNGYPLNALLLYRLIGDMYPLYAGPEFVVKCGSERPIIHGLCSLGYACHMMVGASFPGEPKRTISIGNQFRSVAVPREGPFLHIWETGSGKVVFRMVKDTGRKAILGFGQMTWVRQMDSIRRKDWIHSEDCNPAFSGNRRFIKTYSVMLFDRMFRQESLDFIIRITQFP